MKFLNLLLILMFLLSVACSSNDTAEVAEEGGEYSEEVSDDLLSEDLDGEEVAIEDLGGEDLLLDEGYTEAPMEEAPLVSDDDMLLEDSSSMTNNAGDDFLMEDTSMQPTTMDAGTTDEVVINDTSSYASTEMSGEEGSYTVEKNDTLMWIAFKIYGDYEKWKSIANMNSGSVTGSDTIKEGTVLRYQKPAQEFVWNPQGNPYLIKNGDTLGIISNNVYGTQTKWRSIWDNNRPMIKDPNLIFAGFTLHYLPEDGKVAYNK